MSSELVDEEEAVGEEIEGQYNAGVSKIPVMPRPSEPLQGLLANQTKGFQWSDKSYEQLNTLQDMALLYCNVLLLYRHI